MEKNTASGVNQMSSNAREHQTTSTLDPAEVEANTKESELQRIQRESGKVWEIIKAQREVEKVATKREEQALIGKLRAATSSPIQILEQLIRESYGEKGDMK